MIAEGSITDFVAAHATGAFLVASVLIFLEGYRAFVLRRRYWIFWQCLGEFIALVGLGNDIYNREFLGSFTVAAFLGVEVWRTMRCRSKELSMR
jgi:hypothetical protein